MLVEGCLVAEFSSREAFYLLETFRLRNAAFGFISQGMDGSTDRVR